MTKCVKYSALDPWTQPRCDVSIIFVRRISHYSFRFNVETDIKAVTPCTVQAVQGWESNDLWKSFRNNWPINHVKVWPSASRWKNVAYSFFSVVKWSFTVVEFMLLEISIHVLTVVETSWVSWSYQWFKAWTSSYNYKILNYQLKVKVFSES